MPDVYLSSTLEDLKAERAAVLKVLTDQGFGVKQSYGASETDLVSTCVRDVRACRIYVGIVGDRYGYCPASPMPNPDGLSITELEFQAAAKLPYRFVFVKDRSAIPVPFTDVDSGENGAGSRIADFRKRLGNSEGVVAGQFSTTEDLEKLVLAAVLKVPAPQADPLMTSDDRHPREMMTPVGIVVDALSSQQPADAELARQVQADPRLRLIVVDPEPPHYLARLEEACAGCRAVVWRMDRRALPIYRDLGALMPAALAAQRLRRGGAGLLLAEDVGSDPLPADWQADAVVRVDDTLGLAFDELCRGLRPHVGALATGLADARPVAVPVVVLAMTQAEARSLADGTAAAADGGPDPLRQELGRRLAAQQALAAGGGWPAGIYGPQREDWHPFGPGQPGAMALLRSALERINTERSKRDRVFIRHDGIRLVLHVYRSDDVLQPAHGAQKLLRQVRDRGCLVLVDELSLLHPLLREQAGLLLKSDNVAVVSSQPLDPPSEPLRAMLAERSCLDVGALLRRFGQEHDPRCELTVSNPERLRRWLQMVLPELVSVLGGAEVNPRFTTRHDELYAPTGGAA
ncbi:DUF4062 domain-containing protein [Pseudorhodoferax sp.]|uniref:DUF4062 domain-containing protein n=1 Tax=Pseudorhodoferax sp. TaxID=1993553 RepID=UPI0039E5D179